MVSFTDGWTRRSFLGLAAAGSGIVLSGIAPAHASEVTSAALGSPSAYELAQHGLMNLDGMRAEFADAVATFPFDLPEGYTFPAESSAVRSSAGDLWEVGAGKAEVYCLWQAAMVTAAHQADLAEDQVAANALLRELEAAYDTATRRAVLQDPADYFAEQALPAALPGTEDASSPRSDTDFTPLLAFAGVDS